MHTFLDGLIENEQSAFGPSIYATLGFNSPWNIDGFVKNRHSGENRSAEILSPIEKLDSGYRIESGTGFAGMTKNGIF